eukprot:1895194-Pyramimonas_sp.AAC.1
MRNGSAQAENVCSAGLNTQNVQPRTPKSADLSYLTRRAPVTAHGSVESERTRMDLGSVRTLGRTRCTCPTKQLVVRVCSRQQPAISRSGLRCTSPTSEPTLARQTYPRKSRNVD